MTPRSLVTAIAILFAGCVVATIAAWLSLKLGQIIEMEASHRLRRMALPVLFAVIAIRMGFRLVRGCAVERWFTILVCAALTVGIFINSDGHLSLAFTILAATFGLCAVGLLTPFAGRHFAAKPLPEDDPP